MLVKVRQLDFVECGALAPARANLQAHDTETAQEAEREAHEEPNSRQEHEFQFYFIRLFQV